MVFVGALHHQQSGGIEANQLSGAHAVSRTRTTLQANDIGLPLRASDRIVGMGIVKSA